MGKHSRRPSSRIRKYTVTLLLLLCIAAAGVIGWMLPGLLRSDVTADPVSSEIISSADDVSSEVVSEEASSQEVSSEGTSSQITSEDVSSEEDASEVSESVIVQPEELERLLEVSGYTMDDVADVGQLIITESSGSSAVVHYYEKDEIGQWSMVFEPSNGFVGINGVGDAHEGSLYTPYGLYTLDFAFGNEADPGTAMEYRDVTESIYWVDDPDSRYYNQWVDSETAEVWDWGSAEHLSSVSVYDYAVVIGYNKDCIPGEGSAFFLHSSSGSPTAGCVSVPSEQMVEILRWLDPACNPHIIMF